MAFKSLIARKPNNIITRITSYNVCYTKLLRVMYIMIQRIEMVEACSPEPVNMVIKKLKILYKMNLYFSSTFDRIRRIIIDNCRITSYNVCYTKLLRLSIIFLLSNLLVDILYTVVDPRIRYD